MTLALSLATKASEARLQSVFEGVKWVIVCVGRERCVDGGLLVRVFLKEVLPQAWPKKDMRSMN